MYTMKHFEDQYIGYDGTRMNMAVWSTDNERARAVIIAFHGLGSHGKNLSNIGEYFAQRGFTVFAPDMRGFGHYSVLKGHVMSFDEYVEDIHSIVMHAKDQYINNLTFLFGHSLGGQHVLRYVAKYPLEVDGIILSCPAVSESLEISIWKRVAGAILSIFNIKRYFDNEIEFEDACRDPEVVAQHKNDPLRFDKVTPRFGIEGLKAAKEAYNLARFITVPVLVQQAEADRLVDPKKTREFFEHLGSKDKTWRSYEGLFHELHSEPEKATVLGDMESWLEERLPT